jgi:hypothetical protein
MDVLASEGQDLLYSEQISRLMKAYNSRLAIKVEKP